MCIDQCRHQAGLTLIELVVFIVVVSIGLAGILSVLNFTTRSSANPMLLKQQVAIAESLLEEIESKPFTYCDPDDANVTTAASTAGCATLVQGLGPTTATENRYNSTDPYDNVGDYAGFSMAGILTPNKVTISGLAGYSASVAVAQAGTSVGLTDNTAALRIDVTVNAPGMSPVTLTGYRFRYAPNSP
ncbi:prepilin-type N-terminal cleavage/methylation domain-containing protein [Uliginosibacterium gangwonense]|uniref:prepilin-type N-terminal cleavage/methylation domain-containing protein n=1 Tax=Uliginosibacterium gangwonense TaxID=392736 RepID=UPI00036A80A9|nr:prepilin-type N-terminal cleavage/methylation domain-containing protein [Uliginosibacterium gangwonense]